MQILFTKLLHIGDNLLLTPTLVATKEKFPNSEIWVAVRRGTEGILAGCPEIDRIVTTARPEEGRRTWSDFGRDLLTLAEIASTRFDYAFELGDNNRGRILATASRAKICCTNSYERPEGIPLSMAWKKRFNRLITTGHGPVHQVRRDYNAVRETLGLPEEPPPMRFAREAMRPAPLESTIMGSYAVVHTATRWASKSWPLDSWKQVIAALLKKFPQVVISCGPNPNEIAEAATLCEGFKGRVLSTEGKLSWAQLATLLGSASLFVGVDTAAMHLASAVQCPSVVLFGHPPAYQFQPWKCPHRVVRAHNEMPEKERILISGELLMENIKVEHVLAAIEQMVVSQPAETSLR